MQIYEFKRKIWSWKVYKDLKKNIIKIFYLLPIQRNKIVFDNFGGKGFGDDPKYIAQELLQEMPKLKLIWVTTDVHTKLPSGIKPVKYGTIRAAYHWITAKIWVDNIKSTIRPEKRRGQFYIQTWHSTLGFKKNEADASDLPLVYLKQSKEDGKCIDLMYSDNDFRYDKYKNRFWYEGEVIKCDVPRMSILLKQDQTLHGKVYQELKIPNDKKIVLYAPTFRKNTDKMIYKMNVKAVCKALNNKFGASFEFVMRLHPNEAELAKDIMQEENIINATYYPDMQELLAVSDVLITDYSGCMFDFGFARKPVFLLAKDVEKYLREEREWYFTLSEVPFDLAQSDEMLIHNIMEFDNQKYMQKCKMFEQKVGFSDMGNGAKQISNLILEQINKEYNINNGK
ncbi:CDP-glycerol glycerophosphotransferase family protein [Brotaphodocola sp.]|uniref:CDP-glycerol glycerophosphotransferase family protein n=1 Tax=Brotaphodocola sp. TaxID=3073577 RepID=UPI003D7C3C66